MILYTILYKVDDDSQYCLAYVDESYFNSCNQLDIDKRYFEAEEKLNKFGFEYDSECFINIPSKYSYKEVLKIVSENLKDFKFSNKLDEWFMGKLNDQFELGDWNQEDIYDWVSRIENFKNK